MANLTIKLNDLVLDEPVNGEIDKSFHVVRIRLIYPNYQNEVMEKVMKVSIQDGQALSDNTEWKKSNRSTPYYSTLFKTPIEDECYLEVEVSHGIKETTATKVAEELLKAATSKLVDIFPFGNALENLSSEIDFGPRDPKSIARAFIKINGSTDDIQLSQAAGSTYAKGTLTIPMKAPSKVVKAYYAQGTRGGPRKLVKEEVLKKGQPNGYIKLLLD